MKDSTSVLEAELDYAVRMVRKNFATPEQAARVCGVRLKDVKERLTCERAATDHNAAYRSFMRN